MRNPPAPGSCAGQNASGDGDVRAVAGPFAAWVGEIDNDGASRPLLCDSFA
jgi:hypothetical protein